MATKRILQVAPSLIYGGLEGLVIDLAQRLHATPGFEVEVCLLKEEGERRHELPEVPVVVMSKRPGKDLRLIIRLAGLIRRRGIDLVHAHGPMAYFHSAVAARLAGVPSVYTEHGRDWQAIRPTVRWSELVASRLTSKVVAVSDDTRLQMQRCLKTGPAKTEVIVNGVEDISGATGLKGALGLPDSSLVVGFVGRISPEKGPLYLVEAAGRVLSQRPEARFVFIGEGESRTACEQRGRSLGIGASMLFTGYRTDARRLLPSLDVCVLPSLREGTPLALLEAMAASRPIVASCVGGIPEAVRHGESGLLVAPGDVAALAEAILGILADPSLATRLGRAARQQYEEKYSLEAMFQHYCQLYSSLISQR